VENRLEDLSSLFDFILPGSLGNAEEKAELFQRGAGGEKEVKFLVLGDPRLT
jgi:SNF2 family DNA or RNA helicase